jgi:uncharacterized membrane-anchored protein
MSMKLGYLTSSLIFLGIFIAFVIAQIRADRFKPWFYWSTIVAAS